MIKVGLYRDLSNKDYHSDISSISKSGLLHFINGCPKNYYDLYLKDGRKTDDNNENLILGNLVHAMVLEHKEVQNRYILVPNFDKRTKKGKEEYAEFLKNGDGRQFVPLDTFELALKIGRSVIENNEIMDLIKGSEIEYSIFWKDDETDVMCKCRPDVLGEDYILDLKTTRNCSVEEFSRSIYDYGYHIQAAMMQEGVFKSTGRIIKNFIFACVEKKSPYNTCIYILGDESIEYGKKQYKKALAKYKNCLETNIWASFENKIIDLPAWAMKE